MAILPTIAIAASSSVALAGTTSNQVIMNGPDNCTPLETQALFDYNTLVTVSGMNQNNQPETWRTTDHPDGVFSTTGWWWWGQVTVTVHPSGHAPISFTGLVPASKSSNDVEVVNNEVFMTCFGTQSALRTVDVPHWGPGGNWVSCVGVTNPTGTYYVQRAYAGYFYYNGGTSISGSTVSDTLTPGSYQVVKNSNGQRYAVPLHPTSVINQRVCY
jgi:hypothetical protein